MEQDIIYLKVNKKHNKEFENLTEMLKRNDNKFYSIKLKYMDRNDFFLVSIIGEKDLIKIYTNDLYNLLEKSKNQVCL
jgi:hypothetical protein